LRLATSHVARPSQNNNQRIEGGRDPDDTAHRYQQLGRWLSGDLVRDLKGTVLA
jgi:hypothetical protein